MALNYSTGNAKGVTYANLTKVSGNLAGTATDASVNSNPKSILETTVAKTKHSVNVLKFPIDVDSDPGLGNHGHYMMFYINQQDHAKLSFGDPAEPKQSGSENSKQDLKNRNIPTQENVVIEPAKYTSVTVDNKDIFQNRDPITGATIDRTVEVGDKVKTSNAKYTLKDNNYSIGLYTNNTTGNNSAKGVEFSTGLATTTGGSNKSSNDRTQVATSTNGQNIHVLRAKTTRLSGGIAMYMPANVQVKYGANYEDREIGSMAERAAETIKDLAEGDLSGALGRTLNADSDLVKNVGQFLLSGIGALPGFGGAKELEAMKRGRIISNRMELAFKGINKREFQYTFKMIPRNAKEAEEIQKIIYAFKFNMLPEMEGGDLSGRSFIVPNTFDIEYMYNGNHNQFLHKISTCVLESMNVTYGGDRYKTYTATSKGAPPTETTISLNFREMEMITRERVKAGF